MKADIHPAYNEINVVCSCGNNFKVSTILQDELHLDVCNKCHPFYTGKQKIIDTGTVEKFKQRFGKFINQDQAASS